MLLHLAIGDAYGAGFEYASPQTVSQHNQVLAYFQHPRHGSILPGQYTDDTQMSLAVAEVLLQPDQPTRLDWAEAFCRSFRRDPREGYAGRFQQFLAGVRDGQDFLARIVPHSEKSGAAMRSLPLGFLPDIPTVLRWAEEQARITHDTPGGVLSAQAVALTAHYFLYRLGSLPDLPHFLHQRLGECWNEWTGPVGAPGMQAAQAALTALCRNTSLRQLLWDCVNYTGDVDTVACIALGAAAVCPEYRHDLPAILYQDLENGHYGKDYLIKLQAQLLQRFPGARCANKAT